MRYSIKKTIPLVLIAILLSGCGAGYHVKKGKQEFKNLQFAKAKDQFNTAIEKRPESYESLKLLALTHMKLDDFKAAEKAFELALNYPQVTLVDKYNYARMLMNNGKHAKAELLFREYLQVKPDDKVAKAMLESCQFIELFQDDTALYKIKPLPLLDNISMFSPAIYQDGLAITAERGEKGKTDPWTGNSYYDVFYLKTNGETWNEQVPIAPVFKGVYHDGPICFNEAQDMAIFTRSYVKKGNKRGTDEQNFNNMFLYSSRIDSTGAWTKGEELPFNGKDFSSMHPALTAGGDSLYFASDRPGGQGKNDIYLTTFVEGSWTAPVNLGPMINTPANEVFPTLKKDGSLYFSSNGHPSLGALDIFKTERGEEGEWNKPRNLNYPVNSTADDFSYIFNKSDSTGFFSSNRSGKDKIFEFKKGDENTVTIEGLTLDEEGNILSGVTVQLIDTDTDEVLEETVTGADGKFEFKLKAGGNYKIVSQKNGYFNESFERSTIGQQENETVEVTFNMRKLIVTDPDDFGANDEGVYEVENIYYDFDDFVIRPDAAIELDKLLKLMNDNPKISIELHSHTDSRGKDAYNMNLSDRRARSARAYLVKKGVAPSRIGTKGFGESRIINQCVNGANCSDEEHEANRRTEFIVTSAGQ